MTDQQRSELRVTIIMLAMLIALLIAVPVIVLFVIVGGPWWIGPLLGVATGALVVWTLLRSAHSRVLATLAESARATEEQRDARFENLVEGLALSIGIAEPELLVLRDDARNAFSAAAYGSSSRDGRQTLVVTDTLLGDLTRMELEGVVAELLVRLKTGDAEMATVTAGLIGLPLVDSVLGKATRALGTQLLRQHHDQNRTYEVDQEAVSVTRYPPGLSGALGVMSEGDQAPAASTAGTDHMWVVQPARTDQVLPAVPVDWRIEVLLEI